MMLEVKGIKIFQEDAVGHVAILVSSYVIYGFTLESLLLI